LTEIVLTRKALALLYAGSICLIVTAERQRSVVFAARRGIKILVLERDGVIHGKGEAKYAAEDTVPMPGAPPSLVGVICGKAEKKQVTTLVKILETHNIEITPPVLTLGWSPVFWQRYLCRQFINSFLFENVIRAQKTIAVYNRQLVQQRQAAELVQRQLEKARHMITGIGYDTRYVTVDLAPGTKTLGPGGTVDSQQYEQVLPVACAGLHGISIYVESLPQLTVSAYLSLSIKRLADSKVLLEHDIPVSNLTKGWNGFLPSQVELVSIGDSALQLAWKNADGLLLALSRLESDRFGDGEKQTLALRVYQSLVDPITFDESIQNYDSAPTYAEAEETCLQMSAVPLPDMSDNFSYYLGYEAHEKIEKANGFPIATLNGETRVLQLHPVLEGLAATVYKSAIPQGTLRAACEVGTAHNDAPAFTYILISIPSNADFHVGTSVEDICTAVKKGDASGSDERTGVAWHSVTVHANERRLLELTFDQKTKVPMDAVFAVVPKEDSTMFGWCRWYKFYITSEKGNFSELVSKVS